MQKKFQELTIKDAFMFAAVMADPQQCRRLLSLVLDMEILEVTVIAEKTMVYHPEYHGVRLDVLAVEHGKRRRFNAEMQVRTQAGLPQRSRYYHAQMDMDALLTGEAYEELPNTYVIFICDFDLFGKGLYRYTFKNMCEEDVFPLGDGNITVFLSTKGTNESQVPKALVHFLKYVENANALSDSAKGDSFVDALEKQIHAIKRNRNWEAKFMLLEEMMKEERMEGKDEGQERVNRLIKILAENNRVEDIIKSAGDKEYQQKLFEEFGL